MPKESTFVVVLDALAELRCWVGQKKSAEAAGAKCETLAEALAKADVALGKRCVICSQYFHQHDGGGYCQNVLYSGGQRFTATLGEES